MHSWVSGVGAEGGADRGIGEKALSSMNSQSGRQDKLIYNRAERDKGLRDAWCTEWSFHMGVKELLGGGSGICPGPYRLGGRCKPSMLSPPGHLPWLVTMKMTYSLKASGRVRAISAQISSTTSRATWAEVRVRLTSVMRWLCPPSLPGPQEAKCRVP